MEYKAKENLNIIIHDIQAGREEIVLLKDGLNRNIIRLARSIRQLIQYDQFEWTEQSFVDLAMKLGVSEIHVIDKEGVLRWGNIPDFYGFDFNSTDQTRPFLPALTDDSFELAQEPQRRGADNVLFQYFGVSGQGDAGIIQVGLEPRELETALAKTDIQNRIRDFNPDSHNGFSFIVNEMGEVLYHKDKTLVGESIKDKEWFSLIDREGVIRYNEGEQELILAYKKIGNEIYTVNLYVDAYMVPYYALVLRLLTVLVLSFTGTALLVLFILQRMAARPLNELGSIISEISSGEGDLSRTVNVKSRDEVGHLAGDFNTFIMTLRGIIIKIKESADATVQVKDHLGSTTIETAASVAEITANIGGIKNQIETLDGNIATSSTGINEVQLVIQDLHKEIDEQTAAVEQSSASVHEMVASLKNVAGITQGKKEATGKLVGTTRTGGARMEETVRVVREIHNSIDAISGMVSVINGIASQTNLLSMNAAIEAAHAGDSGKGFAVVADEIRKLAETSAENSKGIGSELKEIVGKIEQASSASRLTNEAFEEIMREVLDVSAALDEITSSTEELSEGGNQILDAMESLNGVSRNVQEGAIKMSEGIVPMTHAMQQVMRISSEVLGSMDEIAAGTGDISHAMEDLTAMTQTLDEASTVLEKEVGRFKTSMDPADI
ncbi:MAG: methyl-accepting chemotaxis protein [Spirochaetales bacterium]|nr:methyl-accepting chemotaxis protein [Spirochaetales bacterium]